MNGIDWTADNIYDAIGRPDLKPTNKDMDILVCPRCGERDLNYGDTGCDTCEVYEDYFKPIEKWKFELIKDIKEY